MNAADVIAKWFEITEIYSKRRSDETHYFFSDREIEELDAQIKLAKDLDETQVTTMLTIQKVLEDYLWQKQIPLGDIVRKQEQVTLFIRLYQDLWDMLNAPEISAIIKAFSQSVRNALMTAGYFSEKQEELLADRYALAILRLSALQSFQDLRIDQFSKGENTTIGELPFVRQVFEFYDVNLMLRAMQRFPDGIFLSLIRDAANDEHSFFAFVIKNGGNVWLVSDKPKWDSPIQKHFPRARPAEKAFNKRVAAHYFPYKLMNVKWDKDRGYFIDHTSYATALVTTDSLWTTIGDIANLEPEETIWIFMLFGLFQRRFFSERPYLKDGLSYTAMQLDIQPNRDNVNALVSTQGGLVVYQPLASEPITFSTLNNQNPALSSIWDYKPTGKNQWAENHYGPMLKDEMLDGLILPPGKQAIRIGKETNTTSLATPKDLDQQMMIFSPPNYSVAPGVELNTFGTEKEVKEWTLWHARNIMATGVQHLIDQEFAQRKDEIRRWYREAVQKRVPMLEECIARGTFEATISMADPATSFDSKVGRRNILTIQHVTDHRYSGAGVIIASKVTNTYPYRWCYLTGAVASIVAEFRVKDGPAIAELLGVPLQSLPVFLQNMFENERYSGNPRVYMGDPMENLHNPWKKENWIVRFYLSKTGYKNLCKRWGTTPQDPQPVKKK